MQKTKTACASIALVGLLLAANGAGQAESIKLVKQPQAQPATSPVPVGQPAMVLQQQQIQEEQIQQEQYEQQRQFELLRQQQQQAELQIQRQQEEAQRLLGRPLFQPAFVQRQESGIKGVGPAPVAPAYDRQPQYAPPQSTIAYLVVRPPYPAPLAYDDSAYRGYQPLIRPLDFPRQPADSSGVKGGRQEPQVQQFEQQQIEQQPNKVVPAPPPPPPSAQPALVVPVQADKHGKLKAFLDRIMAKITLGSSYEVTGEETIYPSSPAPTKSEAPIEQQQIEQQQVEQQSQQEEEPQALQQQQQQQAPIEQQERDQGFDEAPKSSGKSAAPEEPRQIKDEAEQQQQILYPQQQLQQQQIVQEPDLSRQPTTKGSQQPVRQPEPIQQRPEEASKSRKAPAAQQQFAQEPLRGQEAKGSAKY